MNPAHFERRNAKSLLKGSEAGYIQGVGAGISITKGTSGIFTFSLSLNGILATTLARDDQVFRTSLSDEEMKAYEHMFNQYSGGLEMPFLKWLGVNLNNNVGYIDLNMPEAEQVDSTNIEDHKVYTRLCRVS